MVRVVAADQSPETRRVVRLPEMGRLVDDDVLPQGIREGYDAQVNVEVAERRAAPPPGSLHLHRDAARPLPHKVRVGLQAVGDLLLQHQGEAPSEGREG